MRTGLSFCLQGNVNVLFHFFYPKLTTHFLIQVSGTAEFFGLYRENASILPN